MSKTFTYSHYESLPLLAEFFPSSAQNNQTIIYIHGGGLVFGERNDLPKTHLQQLNDAGFNVLMLDYPLAPEVPLPEIITSLKQALDWFLENYQTELGLSSNQYLLFGRSAGAYLSLILSHKHPSEAQIGLISFYGYRSLTLPEFNSSPDYFLNFPRPSYLTIFDLIGEPTATGPVDKRFVIYLYYRQTGNWISKILPDKSLINDYCLTDDDLAKLPKTFLTASEHDDDVPFSETLHLSKTIPDNEFFPVANRIHDYDRDEFDEKTIELYKHLTNWLQQFKD